MRISRDDAEPLEDAARAAEILFHPDGMVLRHRLAPVGHGEIGIGLLRGAKRPCRVVVLEVVELGEPVVEALLRSRCAGVGEADVADAADSLAGPTCGDCALIVEATSITPATRPNSPLRTE